MIFSSIVVFCHFWGVVGWAAGEQAMVVGLSQPAQSRS